MTEPLTIRCRENGPLVITGAIKVVDHVGNAFPIAPGKDTVALCRCGASNSKPFCDGSHKTCGFQAANLAPTP
jgi:CDGSH-type Zn-finger protein